MLAASTLARPEVISTLKQFCLTLARRVLGASWSRSSDTNTLIYETLALQCFHYKTKAYLGETWKLHFLPFFVQSLAPVICFLSLLSPELWVRQDDFATPRSSRTSRFRFIPVQSFSRRWVRVSCFVRNYGCSAFCSDNIAPKLVFHTCSPGVYR